MTDLETAIAGVKRAKPADEIANFVATIITAVLSGDLITREASDARAGALLREAADACIGEYLESPNLENDGDMAYDQAVSDCIKAILALSPDATAALDRAVKAAREEEREYALALEQEMRDRAETPEPPRMSTDNFDCLVLDGLSEAMRAMKKFPQPNYVISKIAEEAGEVVKAAIHCAEGRETYANLRGEMKQLIAMLYRLWIEGDRVHGLPSVSAALAQEVGQ